MTLTSSARAAVMAQRKGELLKMEMLERLAGMFKELKHEVELSSGDGASVSAIATARELLGCHAKGKGGHGGTLPDVREISAQQTSN